MHLQGGLIANTNWLLPTYQTTEARTSVHCRGFSLRKGVQGAYAWRSWEQSHLIMNFKSSVYYSFLFPKTIIRVSLKYYILIFPMTVEKYGKRLSLHLRQRDISSRWLEWDKSWGKKKRLAEKPRSGPNPDPYGTDIQKIHGRETGKDVGHLIVRRG